MLVDHWSVLGRTKSATGQMVPHTRRRTKEKWPCCSERAASLPYMMETATATPWLQPFCRFLRVFRMGMFGGDAEWAIRVEWERAHATLWRRSVKKQLFTQFGVTQLLVFVIND